MTLRISLNTGAPTIESAHKVAILGGGNPFGLNLAQSLHAAGIAHFGIGRSARKHPAMWVEHHYPYWQLHLLKQLNAVMALLDEQRPDVIVNFAAQGEGQGSFGSDACKFYMTNAVVLVRLVEELRHRDYLQRFVQIGTSELYGSVTKPSVETDPLMPTSPYAVSKAAFDQHLAIMWRVHKFPCNVVRPSNSYSRGQQLHRIIPKAIITALRGERLPLHGGGHAEKSYIHADDLSRGIMQVIASAPFGEVYNCGPEQPIQIQGVVRLCAMACGVEFDSFVDIVGERLGQDGRYFLDSSKLKALGWSPEVKLYDGIKDIVEWLRKYPEVLEMSLEYRIRE